MGVLTQPAMPFHFQKVLSRAADLLSEARSVEDLSWAISDNLSVWLSLSAATSNGGTLPGGLAAIASAGARHTIGTTLASGRVAPPDQAIEEFIRLNRQMAALLADLRGPLSSPPS